MQAWSRGSAVVQNKCQNGEEMWSKWLWPRNDWVSQKLPICWSPGILGSTVVCRRAERTTHQTNWMSYRSRRPISRFPALPRPSFAGSCGRGIIGSRLRGRGEGLDREDRRMQQRPRAARNHSRHWSRCGLEKALCFFHFLIIAHPSLVQVYNFVSDVLRQLLCLAHGGNVGLWLIVWTGDFYTAT